jgi:hypothetical protein
VGGLVAAAILFIIATALLLDRYTWLLDGWFVPGAVTAAVLLLVGAVIVGLGIAGRRAGGMTAVALVTVFLGLPIIGAADIVMSTPGGVSVGERAWAPASPQAGGTEFSLTVGDALLDLREFDTSGGASEVGLTFGVGQATLIVPQGVPTRIESRVRIGGTEHGLGEDWIIKWESPTDNLTRNQDALPDERIRVYVNGSDWLGADVQGRHGGLSVNVTADSPEVAEGAEPALTVNVKGDIGNLRIIEGEAK